MIYLDNAATTYPKPDCVYNQMLDGCQNYLFNSGRGSYSKAVDTYKMIDSTRSKLAAIVNVNKNRVIFTSSATESLNDILYGLNLKKGDNVYVTPFEHNAVIRPLYALGVNIIVIPFDKSTWEIDYCELNNLMALHIPKCVAATQISNVVGFEIPYTKIFEISKKYNSINILDASQGFGIYNIDSTSCDYIVFAGHKSLYGIFGVAGYIKLSDNFQQPHKIGGTGSDSLNLEMPKELPNMYEAGSMNSLAIYSLYNSIDYITSSNFALIKEGLTSYLIGQLKSVKDIVLYLPEGYISKGIVSFNMRGYSAEDVGNILSDCGICVRTGYHCAPLVHDLIDSKPYNGTIRISLGIFNTQKDIDELVKVLNSLE